MQENKNALFDVRTLLFLDIVIMVFMLISGKPEVTLCSFIVAAAVPVITELNLFGNFSFRTGCLKMRCSKSCYLHNLELVDLFGNGVTEQVYYRHQFENCQRGHKRRSFNL